MILWEGYSNNLYLVIFDDNRMEINGYPYLWNKNNEGIEIVGDIPSAYRQDIIKILEEVAN